MRNLFCHWNADVYDGDNESFKTHGPMALRVVVFLEDSLVEQRVCFVFKHTCRNRRFI